MVAGTGSPYNPLKLRKVGLFEKKVRKESKENSWVKKFLTARSSFSAMNLRGIYFLLKKTVK